MPRLLMVQHLHQLAQVDGLPAGGAQEEVVGFAGGDVVVWGAEDGGVAGHG